MYHKASFNVGSLEYYHSSVQFAKERHVLDGCDSFLQLIYIAKGKGTYSCEGIGGEIKSGLIMLVLPFEYHKIVPEENKPFEIYKLKFTRKDISTDVLECFESLLLRDVYSRIYINRRIVVQGLLERMETASSIQQQQRALYLKMLLSEIIMHFSFENAVRDVNEKIELGERVIRYLNENIDRDLSLDYIAQRFFVSKYYLCRAFKKHNGISVHGYINRKRVLLAKALIEGGESAADAAYKVGFGDYSAFYRSYVKIFGKSPMQDVNSSPEDANGENCYV